MFLVLALPRSRTYWLSKFLSYGDYSCGHEEARYLRSLEDAKTWLEQDFHGSAETAIAPFWRLIDPAINIVVVRRPVADVVKSLMALDLSGVLVFSETVLRARMERLDAKLQQIAKRLPNVLSVDYADLDREEVVKAVWEHCLPYKFDAAWWEQCRSTNMQCNMRALARYVLSYREPMDKIAKIAAAHCRAQIAVRPPQSSDGVTFQQETFGAWVRDGQRLFAEHLVEVGEAPDNWKNKDLPLMKMMYDTGYMQITTARANGRMFGYLMAVLNPSLEVRGEFTGLHNTFYVSKDMPGIGVKLQRASLAALKARGARAALFYAGVRGDGPRMGALYRRLGAEEFGSLYRLELGA
jgi:hypothetical protein